MVGAPGGAAIGVLIAASGAVAAASQLGPRQGRFALDFAGAPDRRGALYEPRSVRTGVLLAR